MKTAQTTRSIVTPRSPLTALVGVALLLTLTACETMGEPPEPSASMGLLLARDRCSSCHLTVGGSQSPNSLAPPFGDIVNRPGVTTETLTAWLRDGHNYPMEMGFRLQPYQIDSLAAYMIRWKIEGASPES